MLGVEHGCHNAWSLVPGIVYVAIVLPEADQVCILTGMY